MASSPKSSGLHIDFGKAGTYWLEDKDWTIKVGILVVLGLIPGLNLIIWGGYALTVARRVMYGNPPLPSWDGWADIAVRGLLSIAATLIYFSPALVLTCCLIVIAPFAGSRTLSLVAQCCTGSLALIYILAVNFVLTAGHLRYAQTDQFNVYLDFGARFADLRKNPNFFVTLFIYQTILSLIAAFLAAILVITCVGPFAFLTLAFLANGFILGSAGVTFIQRKTA